MLPLLGYNVVLLYRVDWRARAARRARARAVASRSPEAS